MKLTLIPCSRLNTDSFLVVSGWSMLPSMQRGILVSCAPDVTSPAHTSLGQNRWLHHSLPVLKHLTPFSSPEMPVLDVSQQHSLSSVIVFACFFSSLQEILGCLLSVWVWLSVVLTVLKCWLEDCPDFGQSCQLGTCNFNNICILNRISFQTFYSFFFFPCELCTLFSPFLSLPWSLYLPPCSPFSLFNCIICILTLIQLIEA